MAEPEVHVLQFVRGKYAGQEFALDAAGSYIAGRSSEADLVLADDSVSRKHARFYHERGRTWVRDLGSRNGTKINGKTIKRHCLRNGDRVAIGATLMHVAVMQPGQVSDTFAGRRKRGAADPGTGRSMSGSIEDIPLVDVLQWLATSRKTGTLKVRSPAQRREGALSLRDGQVFFASIEGSATLDPEKALMRMLLWDKGMFELDAKVMDDAPTELSTSLEHMLMEAARQQDEMAALAAKSALPGPTDRIIMVHPSPVRWKELEPDQIDVLQAVSEASDWGPALDAVSSDDLTATKAVVALKKKGVVTW